MILRPLNGRQRQVAPAPQRPANPNRMNQGDQVIQNQPVDNPQAQRANRRNQGPPVNQNQPGGNPPVQANQERIMAELRPLSFKDIKIASEAMQAMIPRFSGENPDELYSSWLQRFTREANALTLGHQLTALVFPRLLTGKAQLKYQTLTEQQQAEFGLAAQALEEKLRSVGSCTKAMNYLEKIYKSHSERRRSIVTIPEIFSIMTIGGKTYLPFIPIHLNGVPSVALLDSGASVSLIPERVIKILGIERSVEKTTCSAKVANGTKLKFLGKTKINITVGKTKTTHEFLVVKNTETPAPCLMGIDFINRLNVLGQSVTFNLPENHVKVGNDKVDLWKPEEEGCAENGTITVVCAEDGSHKQHQDSETSEISEDSDASEESEENESEKLEGQDQTEEFGNNSEEADDVDEKNRGVNDNTVSWPDEENSRCDAAKGLNPM